VPLGQRSSDRWAMNETVVFREILAGIAPIEVQENLFLEKVKALLQRAPHTQGDLASALCVSIPTLQRRLLRAGKNYRQLSQEVRANHLTLLLATSMNLDDIASEMSFSDRRSLTRACHQWLGSTPSAYRKSRRLTK
jgi:AraC-like DNA-binding protein